MKETTGQRPIVTLSEIRASVARMKRNSHKPILVTALLAMAYGLASDPAYSRDQAGDFDYYVLSLSWSPTYCASNAGRKDRQQCGGARAFDLVVHGLWPQYRRGWPDYCKTRERYVPNRQIGAMLDIMPSKRLVIHEWKKHGTCSGLSQRQYFEVTRKLFEAVRKPARYVTPRKAIITTPGQLVRDFLSTNRWLKPDGISVHCGNQRDRARLREIRLCFTRDLKPRSCGENERRSCRARQLVMPPVR